MQTPNSTFRVAKLQAPTAFPTTLQMWGGIIKSLQWPRPKGCWGTVVYLWVITESSIVLSVVAMSTTEHPSHHCYVVVMSITPFAALS